jgi:RNA polymerase sigma factor (sigma-70 family)
MATLPTPSGDDLTPKQLFLGHLKLIEDVIAHCCRRSRFQPEEKEDFQQTVMLKLIEDDYAVFRLFQGRSNIKTYLTVVINRLLLDYQDHIWGKWRPSAEAERLGRLAMRLERLLVRDELSFDGACQTIWGEGVTESEQELQDLAAKLPPRSLRRFVSEEVIENEASHDPRPDEHFEQEEWAADWKRLTAKLFRALATLPAEDQILVRMRTEFKVADIARLRKMDQKSLYRRLDKIYARLEKELEWLGARRQDVENLLRALKPGLLDF